MDTVERLADYELVGPLGRGGSGVFHLARPPDRLGLEEQFVALKVLDGTHPPDRFRRVADELRYFAAVRSPYLVSLYDAGREGGRLWYAMAYYPAGSLAAPAEPLSRADRLRAVAHAARGAHALHEAGVVHRDIKPANIMLTDDGARLADLELAHFLNPGMTITATAPMGDIEFTDPAIIRGERATRATDVWSLGVTLHSVLAGRSVYGDLPDGDMLGAVRRVLSGQPTVSDQLAPPEAEVVQACLAAEPARRPPMAVALAEMIEAL
jgi:serine/threonine protein kinase